MTDKRNPLSRYLGSSADALTPRSFRDRDTDKPASVFLRINGQRVYLRARPRRIGDSPAFQGAADKCEECSRDMSLSKWTAAGVFRCDCGKTYRVSA